MARAFILIGKNFYIAVDTITSFKPVPAGTIDGKSGGNLAAISTHGGMMISECSFESFHRRLRRHVNLLEDW